MARRKEKMDVYEIVTEQIIESLEAGVVPWRRPWKAVGGPRNLNSGRPYRGINSILLSLAPHESPYWVTFKGAKQLGGHVRKGERGTLVVLWKWVSKNGVRPEGDEEEERQGYPMLRYYRVWNTDQCDGLEVPEPEEAEEFEALAAAEEVFAGYVGGEDGPAVTYGGDRAYYSPPRDVIGLPPREAFDDAPAFYSTAFHEAVHSTGSPGRLARFDGGASAAFGSETYSKEELVAEMGAAFLCGATGVEPRHEQSAAYIAAWLRRLRDDKKLVVSAAGQAQKAADLVLGHDPAGGSLLNSVAERTTKGS